MKIDGSCHCGAITYEADIDPEKVGICHCTDCQKFSGSAFRTLAQTEPGGFRLLTGTPKVYVKVGESGNERPQAFCGECGSSIYATSTDPDPKVYNVRAGTIRQRNELVPKFQVWTRSAHEWLGDLSAIKSSEKGGA